MINTASLTLCKQLYKLSGWDDTYWHYAKHKLAHSFDLSNEEEINPSHYSKEVIWYSAYDLGYLLRKLPTHDKEGIHATFSIGLVLGGKVRVWNAVWECDTGEYYLIDQEDTPEAENMTYRKPLKKL